MEERQYLAVAAFSCYPGETFLSEIMSDDRVSRQSAEPKNALQGELQHLSDLPMYAWSRMALHVAWEFEASEL